MGWGQWKVCPSPLARLEWRQQLGQWSPLKIKQCDIMLGARHSNLNLRDRAVGSCSDWHWGLGQVTQWTKFCLVALASC